MSRATARFMHESNTFSRVKTDMALIRRRDISKTRSRRRFAALAPHSALPSRQHDKYGCTLVHPVSANPNPSGIVTAGGEPFAGRRHGIYMRCGCRRGGSGNWRPQVAIPAAPSPGASGNSVAPIPASTNLIERRRWVYFHRVRHRAALSIFVAMSGSGAPMDRISLLLMGIAHTGIAPSAGAHGTSATRLQKLMYRTLNAVPIASTA